MNRLVSDRTLGFLVPFIVLFALSVTLFSQARFAADRYEYNVKTFASLENGMDSYCKTVRQEWRPRFLTNWMVSKTISSISQPTQNSGEYWEVSFGDESRFVGKESFRSAVGNWVVFWFFLSGLLFIFIRKERSLFYLFGMYAAISMAYSPGVAFPEVIQIYPWDMPALFFFALFVFLVETNRWNHLLWMIPLAVGFKETALVLCPAVLFCCSKPWKNRFLWFAGTVALCLAVKAGIGVLTNPEQLLFTMTSRERVDDPLRLGINLFIILRYKWPATPLLVNAGTLLAFFFLPISSRMMVMLKTLALFFVSGIFTFGLINEIRIFFEMIPFALYGLDAWLHEREGRGFEVETPVGLG